ncbi:hypothetical protein AB0I28_11710 [Phytomonospora sp. NPDC050363]|uniref:hypothetical protein n=1 Tax=Phytomonospora sp. NPDC050363 TaxID=3155642 RepID=UPI0033E0C565
MAEPGRTTAKKWVSPAIFVVWTAAALAVGGVALSGLERLGSASGWAILTGTARVENCAPSWFGAPYECRAEVTWTDKVTGEPWREDVAVYSMSALSGEVAVERRTDEDRKADEKYGRVYPVGHPVQSARTFSVIAIFAVLLATVLIPVRLRGRARDRKGAKENTPATEAAAPAARRAAEKRPRRRK